jgi:hypothetical protein
VDQVSARFEELDWRTTGLGDISLRRRRDPLSGDDVYEVKLDDDFLMSSLFTVAEIELARLALAELAATDLTGLSEVGGPVGLDVVVGGLGLGYTAATVLEHRDVRSLVVIEALAEVIDWHERGLVPAAAALTSDARCRLVPADFFALVGAGLDPDAPGRRFHAVIVDIDHAPRHLLHRSHAGFYQPAGVRALAGQLLAGGVFALWSNDPPDEDYLTVLAEVFTDVRAEIVRFPNPIQGGTSTNTVYIGRTPATSPDVASLDGASR